MPELSVVIVAQDSEQRAILQVLVDGTSVARTVHSCATFPVVATDPVVRRIQTATPDVALVDVPGDNPTLALRAAPAAARLGLISPPGPAPPCISIKTNFAGWRPPPAPPAAWVVFCGRFFAPATTAVYSYSQDPMRRLL